MGKCLAADLVQALCSVMVVLIIACFLFQERLPCELTSHKGIYLEMTLQEEIRQLSKCFLSFTYSPWDSLTSFIINRELFAALQIQWIRYPWYRQKRNSSTFLTPFGYRYIRLVFLDSSFLTKLWLYIYLKCLHVDCSGTSQLLLRFHHTTPLLHCPFSPQSCDSLPIPSPESFNHDHSSLPPPQWLLRGRLPLSSIKWQHSFNYAIAFLSIHGTNQLFWFFSHELNCQLSLLWWQQIWISSKSQ